MQKITIQIDGMACGMCEAHVNDAVRSAFPVKKVESSHKKGTTQILTEQEVDEAKLRSVIEESGYRVVRINTEPYEKKKFSFFGIKG